MDKSKILQQMADSADLLGMVEEMLGQSQNGRISPTTLSGIRITLRNARRAVVEGHGYFADHLVNPASDDNNSKQPTLASQIERDVTYENGSAAGIGMTDSQRMFAKRKDLRASLEKIVERS